jgi:hypothetical protein
MGVLQDVNHKGLQSQWPDTDWDKVESPPASDNDMIAKVVDIGELKG